MYMPLQAQLQAKRRSDATPNTTAKIASPSRSLGENRPVALAQHKLAEMMNSSPRVLQQRALNGVINSSLHVVQREESGAQLHVQAKMAEISQLLRQRFVDESRMASDEQENVTNTYVDDVLINGLCGGWAVLFMQFPEWVEPIYNAVRTWIRPQGASDVAALQNFENHLAKTTDVSKDGRGANHVIKLLRDAYATMSRLEPAAGYSNLPEWTDVNADRNLWINPAKTATKDRTIEFDVTNITAAKKVADYLCNLTQARKVECMAHIESDQHHMAIRVERGKAKLMITVVETELAGMKKVDEWSEAETIINNWLVSESTLRSITVRTKIIER